MFADLGHRSPAGNASHSYVYRSIAISAGSTGGFRKADFDTVGADPDGLWNAQKQRFEVKRSGLFFIRYDRRRNAAISSAAMIAVNGVDVMEGSNSSTYDSIVCGFQYLDAGDCVEAFQYVSSSYTLGTGSVYAFSITGPFS